MSLPVLFVQGGIPSPTILEVQCRDQVWTNPTDLKSIFPCVLFLILGTNNGFRNFLDLECPATMNGNSQTSANIYGKFHNYNQSIVPRKCVVNNSARLKKEDKATSIIHSNAIDLKTLDIKPTNIFFYPPDEVTEDHLQIFVKMVSSKTITLDVRPTDTVAEVKSVIYQLQKIPTDQQRLLYNAKELKDQSTMSEVGNNATLHLALHLVGGIRK